MGPCCNSGWKKLDKYYTLTGNTPVYVTSVVLDPTQKWTYFEESWGLEHPEWLVEWKEKVEDFWASTYRMKDNETDFIPSSSPKLSDNLYVAHLQSKKLTKVAKDEYARYLSLPPVDDVRDPRSWWLEPTQQKLYPNLSKMALDLLTIPAMSADAERIFSGCKLQMTHRRNRMSVKVLEALELLKSWMNLTNWEAHDAIEDEDSSDGDGINDWTTPYWSSY